jgi:hypothetical protein
VLLKGDDSAYDSDADRARLEALRRRLHIAVRATVVKIEPVAVIDSGHDLARVVRVPGTLNGKECE